MSKLLTISGIVVAILVLALFALDLAIGIPFKRASMMIDVAFIVSSLVLGYLSWSSLRELQ